MRRIHRLVPLVLLASSLLALFLSRGAETVPLYAARTGLMCQNCHFDPNGGGPRNDFGFAFARNRHSLDLEPDSTSPWHDLSLTNRIGETMPVYLGINHRFMMLTNDTKNTKGPDRFGFFNMENALHIAFQPHARLTLVYTMDAFANASGFGSEVSKDAFGMVGGFPWNGYLKAGRIRVPFGLRLDDHTVATRNAFLDLAGEERFLPYDPRRPDMGLEIGVDHSGWFGRAALTNGTADVLNAQFAETKTGKIGFNSSRFQAAASFYDNYEKEHFDGPKRATRWGLYGITHAGPAAFLGEVAAGTDEDEPVSPGLARGPKTNRLAWFAEVDYTPIRWFNARLRYDWLQYDRSSDPDVRDANTHRRYALEAEYVPVPFAELRATFRRIDHEDEVGYGFEDETQGYLQFHFSY